MFLFCLLIGFVTIVVRAAEIIHNWEIGSIAIARTSGPARQAIGVNGKLPVPPVVATLGDTIIFNVRNLLQEPTSLHIHGYLYNGISYLDGVSMISSCSIAPNSSFTYTIPAVQAGTFFVHAHSHHQNADGLRGPLVVRNPQEAYAYSKEYVFSFEDWHAVQFKDRLFAALHGRGRNEALPDAMFPGMLVNGASCQNTSTLVFDAGKTYRIRLVNMASTMWYEFSIEGHMLAVIELDGVLSDKYPVQSVHLAPAQRVSVLVTATSRSSDTGFRYVVKQYSDFMERRPGKNPSSCYGSVRHSRNQKKSTAAEVYEGIAPTPKYRPFSDISMSALDNDQLLSPDRQVRLELGSGLFADGRMLNYINNITFAEPLVPAIYTALTAGSLALDSRVYGPRTNAIVLHSGEVVELLVWNNGAMFHSMHLHGHAFQIVEYGCTGKAKCDGSIPARAAPVPMRRDTVVVGPHQYAVLRFRADNPGMWLFHCHLDIHHALGMALVFAAAPDALQHTLHVPQSVSDQCRAQGIKLSGNAAGNIGLNVSGAPAALARV